MNIRLSALAAACALVHPAFALAQTAQADRELAQVVVTASRQQQRADEVLANVEVIERDRIEQAGHSTLLELLATQPGIRVVSNGGAGSNASVFMRGAESRHTLLLIDGMRVGSATTGQAALEMIPLALVDRVEILRGPASALYGSEAIGGVIQVFTRKSKPGFFPSAYAGFGTESTWSYGAGLTGGVDRLRYSLAVGHDETEGFNSKPDPSRVFGANPDKDGFRNDYLNASVTLGLREGDELGVNLLQSEGRNWYDTNRTYDSYLDKRTTAANLFMTNRIASAWTSTLRLGHSTDEVKDRSTAARPSLFDTEQTQLMWQNDVRLPVGALMAAYEYLDQHVGGTTSYVEDNRHIHAFLLGWTASFGAHSLQINARHDDNSRFGGETTGYLGYSYEVVAGLRVLGSIGSAFNAPTFNQLYFPDTGFGGGNPDLKPERALNRELGVRWDQSGHAVGLTYYNNRVTDLISGWPPQNVNKAQLAGYELTYNGQFFGYRVRAGLDVLDARNERTNKRLPRRADEAAFASVDRSFGEWTVGVDWNGQGRRFENVANTQRMHGYGLLSAFVHYAINSDLRLELRANNILDKEYELARGFATPGANAFLMVRYAPR